MAGDTYTGQILDGKYRLTNLLGKGGMGAVYRGEHVIIGKQVAVKFLHAEFANNTEVVKRFYREAQAAAAIGHDGIIDVSDVGTSSLGDPYLVMEYLEGESLADMLTRTGPLEAGAACGIMEPALQALHAAHAKGIVHRDLKPENIFLVHQQGSPPKIKLIDFGISKFAEAGSGEKLTQTGSVMGTPVYMSPEQARGAADLDHRADLYSMGVILYEMLTARLPFEGGNFTEIIINILTSAPRPPAEAFPGFPAEAEPVVLRALEKDPARRFATALDFIGALAQLTGFDKRQSKLTHVASQIKKTTFAAGSLGTQAGDSGAPVGADVLAQMAARAGTPSGWAGTRPERPRKRNRTLLAVGLAAGAISIAGAVALVLVLRGTEDPVPVQIPLASPAVAAPAEAPAAAVAITVTGHPEGSRVFFDDMLVTVNPFKVKRSEAVTPLRIEAEGFDPLIVTVVPSADQTVAIPALTPATPKPEVGDQKTGKTGKTGKAGKAKKHEPPAASVSPSPAPDKAADKKKLEQGARGTKVSTEFE
jgi:tRNA A-37 threonylcarbamoyl transferase component Bud32